MVNQFDFLKDAPFVEMINPDGREIIITLDGEVHIKGYDDLSQASKDFYEDVAANIKAAPLLDVIKRLQNEIDAHNNPKIILPGESNDFRKSNNNPN